MNPMTRRPAKRSLKRSLKSPALSKNHLNRNSSSPRAEAAEQKWPLLQQKSLLPRSKKPQAMARNLRMQRLLRRQARVEVAVVHARLSMKKWSVRVKTRPKKRMLKTLTQKRKKKKRCLPSPKLARVAKPQRLSSSNSNSSSSKKRTIT